MISPEQTLLHVNSRGSRVRKYDAGAVGQFINDTKQPIKNVNKFGLLHYSIPKSLDMVDYQNRTFYIRISYQDGATEYMQPPIPPGGGGPGHPGLTIDAQAIIPVTLPELDYYNTRVDVNLDGDKNMYTDNAYLTEILQTSINWAIQKSLYSLVPAGAAKVNRLGCVVKRASSGLLDFYFGYRGNVHTVTAEEIADPTSSYYNGGANPPAPLYGEDEEVVKPSTGCPWPANQIENPNLVHKYLRVMSQATNRYNWIDTKATPHSDVFTTATAVPPIDAQQLHNRFALKSVEFFKISPRVQYLIGNETDYMFSSKIATDSAMDAITAAKTTSDTRIVRRGRVCLVDYKDAGDNNKGSGIIKVEMPVVPNIAPPSFMFLNLMAQGTKTKILGHDAERGGWAVPCDSSGFRSSYDNFPWGNPRTADSRDAEYSYEQVRNMPMLENILDAKLADDAAKGDLQGGQDPVFFQVVDDDLLVHFDPVCARPQQTAMTFLADGGGMELALCEDDYSLVPNPAAHNPGGGPMDWSMQFRFGSRMIHYGRVKDMRAAAGNPREKQFAIGPFAESPAFTVSMITPSWIYTEVPTSTVQTLDVQLMWGDTGKNVTDRDLGTPCQFSIIASQ